MDKDSNYICALTYLMEVDHLWGNTSGALHYTLVRCKKTLIATCALHYKGEVVALGDTLIDERLGCPNQRG